jgi:uncharacterized protein YqjF (DUF2071 family)
MDVMIDSSYSAHSKLVFNASGLFLAVANRIKSSDLPTAVTVVLAANYSAYTFRDKAEVFTLADNSKQYKVFLHQTGIRLSVIIKEDGTVVCEQ